MADNSKPPVRTMIKEAVDALGGEATNVELRDWVLNKYRGTNPLTIQAQIVVCTVNHDSRVHYPENHKPRLANDPRYDFLYRTSRGHAQLYDPAIHGRWSIVERENGEVTVRLVEDGIGGESNGFGSIQLEDVPDADASASFAAEDHLRDYLAQHLNDIEPGLQLFVDDSGKIGLEYTTPVGRIDILAVDAAGGLVIIELKVGRGSDAVCGQILRYKGWIKEHLAGGRPVRGMIVAEQISDRIHYAMSDISDVLLKEYQLQVTVRDAVRRAATPD